MGLDYFFANPNVQATLEHVPRLIVAAMKMWRSNATRRAWWTAGVAPFGNHKRVVDRANVLSSEGRSDVRRTHECVSPIRIECS